MPPHARWPRAAHAVCAAVAWTLSSCASPGIPPGGPPDSAAPQVVEFTPDSGALNVRASSVTIRFDEVVSEGSRMPGAGAVGLAAIVIVSPGDGLELVRWHRNAIEIEPRKGFRAGTAYHVTLLPGVVDLRGNVMTETHDVVFSTGAEIPEGTISGVVFDWVAGASAPQARVEAFLPSDSTFRWFALADSTGRYALRNLRPGTYALRAFIDQNRNRGLDRREAFAAVVVRLDSANATDLYAFVHDSVGPRLETVAVIDSTALRARFNTAVAVDWAPGEGSFVLIRSDADSAIVPLGEAVPAARSDSLAAAMRAAADTAADTVADTVADTRTAADSTIARVAPASAADSTADSAAAPAPRPGRPTPSREWVIRLLTPLAPGSYLLRAVDIPGLGGARETSEHAFTVAAPAAAGPEAVPEAGPGRARAPAPDR